MAPNASSAEVLLVRFSLAVLTYVTAVTDQMSDNRTKNVTKLVLEMLSARRISHGRTCWRPRGHQPTISMASEDRDGKEGAASGTGGGADAGGGDRSRVAGDEAEAADVTGAAAAEDSRRRAKALRAEVLCIVDSVTKAGVTELAHTPGRGADGIVATLRAVAEIFRGVEGCEEWDAGERGDEPRGYGRMLVDKLLIARLKRLPELIDEGAIAGNNWDAATALLSDGELSQDRLSRYSSEAAKLYKLVRAAVAYKDLDQSAFVLAAGRASESKE